MTEPIFAAVFAEQWSRLPPVFKAHYANRPFSSDRVTVEGTLTIRMGPMMRAIAPVMALLGMLTPCEGDKVPCTVHFLSEPKSDAFVFERRFAFPGRKPHVFRSRLIAKGPFNVVEYMPCGVGWRCAYIREKDKIILRHKGYVLRLFGVDVPMNVFESLLGYGSAYEEVVDATRFRMHMGVDGGLFGSLMGYSYEGEFMVTEMALAG